MECNVCEQQRTKLYCNKCVKEGIRQQSYQHHAVSRKKDEALQKVNTHLGSDSRLAWTSRAERDEKKLLISVVRQEIERLQGIIRKGTHPVLIVTDREKKDRDWRMSKEK
jgi:hypothetical protein